MEHPVASADANEFFRPSSVADCFGRSVRCTRAVEAPPLGIVAGIRTDAATDDPDDNVTMDNMVMLATRTTTAMS